MNYLQSQYTLGYLQCPKALGKHSIQYKQYAF